MPPKKSDRDPLQTCREILEDESRCGAYRMKGLEYCRVHDPSTKEKARADLDNNRDKALAKRKENAQKEDITLTGLYRKPKMQMINGGGIVPAAQTSEDFRRYLTEMLPHAIAGRLGGLKEKVFTELCKAIQRTFEAEGSYPPPPVQPDGYSDGSDGSREYARAMPEENDAMKNPLADVVIPEGVSTTDELLSDLDLGQDEDEEDATP